jgi:hypothetical protein
MFRGGLEIGFALSLGLMAASGRHYKQAMSHLAPGREGRRHYPGLLARRDNFTETGWRHRQRYVRVTRIALVVLLIAVLLELVAPLPE